jgi:hypothetical protein
LKFTASDDTWPALAVVDAISHATQRSVAKTLGLIEDT